MELMPRLLEHILQNPVKVAFVRVRSLCKSNSATVCTPDKNYVSYHCIIKCSFLYLLIGAGSALVSS